MVLMCTTLRTATATGTDNTGPSPARRCAFVTGGYGYYVLGLDCLLCRLRQLGSKYDRIVALFQPDPKRNNRSELSRAHLRDLTCFDSSVRVVKWPYIRNPYNIYGRETTREERNHIRRKVGYKGLHKMKVSKTVDVMTKLNVFRTLPDEYDRLVWVDPDVLLMRNIDFLCELPEEVVFAATRNKEETTFSTEFNAGIFMLTPMREEQFQEKLLQPMLRRSFFSFDGTEQGVIASYIFRHYTRFHNNTASNATLVDITDTTTGEQMAGNMTTEPRLPPDVVSNATLSRDNIVVYSKDRAKFMYLFPKPRYNLYAILFDQRPMRWKKEVSRAHVIHFTVETKPWSNGWRPSPPWIRPITSLYILSCPNMAYLCTFLPWCSNKSSIAVRYAMTRRGLLPHPNRLPRGTPKTHWRVPQQRHEWMLPGTVAGREFSPEVPKKGKPTVGGIHHLRALGLSLPWDRSASEARPRAKRLPH